MFELTELYAAWTEDPGSFWAETDTPSRNLQEMLAVDPAVLLDDEVWSQILVSSCPPAEDNDEFDELASEWLGTIVHSLRDWSQSAAQANTNQDRCQEALEKLLFLTRMHLARLDVLFTQANTAITVAARKSTVAKRGPQLTGLLAAVSRSLQGGISTAFPATASSKRAALAMLYLEPSCQFMHHDIVVKDAGLVREIVRVVSLGVKLQHQDAVARTQLLQLITFYENSIPAVIHVLETLKVQFDHVSLAEGLLKDVATEASSWTDSQSTATVSRAKSVNAFLTGLSRVMPEMVASNLSSIAMLIGSPVPQLRQAVLDLATPVIKSILADNADQNVSNTAQSLESLVISLPDGADDNANDPVASLRGRQTPRNGTGNVSSESLPGTEQDSSASGYNAGPLRLKQAFDLIKLVELRVNDVSHFCRLRAVQVLASVVSDPAFIGRRGVFAKIAVVKMKDRTQLVRRQAMRLMKQLIDTHPPIINANNLSRQTWQSSLDQIEEQLAQTEPGDIRNQLEAAHAFVTFTLSFLDDVDKSLVVAQTLLQSKSKSDILDAIDLLVYADAYGIETSQPGIRSILHLVWAKADNDEDNTVLQTAVVTYRDLFMTAPPDLDARRGAQVIADNLIKLTNSANQGELTSLERLLGLAVEANYVTIPVVGRLWGLYQTQSDINPSTRRGAAILLAMLSAADRSIACSGLRSVLQVGFGEHGRSDLIFAAYSCTILRRSVDVSEADGQRLPPSYELFTKLIDFLLLPVDLDQSMEWTFMAKEALAALCNLCESPSKLYTKLIVEYTSRVFGTKASELSNGERTQLFAQLLYLAGEISLNLLVYLERSELEFKKRSQEEKMALQQNSEQTEAEQEEAMMAGGGSREDDFQDVLRDIKEDGILFSDDAILKPFAEIVVEICQTNLDRERQLDRNDDSTGNTVNNLVIIGATQTLAKFMCVSSKFCERHLPLLVQLMGHYPNSIVRSNFVVALGDIAICFNRLIDQHTEYLYDRLNDSDPEVQRTCIVALTFLILAGQIKVKGKLGEMAKAITHPNRKIAKLTTMFFRELATKENAIYNSFLDMLSTLVSDESLSETDMLHILRFLAKFVDRERHMKQLTDKLLARLPRCVSQRQWSAYVQVIRSLPRKLDDETKDIIAQGYTRNPGEAGADDDSMDDEETNAADERPNEEDEVDQKPDVSSAAGDGDSRHAEETNNEASVHQADISMRSTFVAVSE